VLEKACSSNSIWVLEAMLKFQYSHLKLFLTCSEICALSDNDTFSTDRKDLKPLSFDRLLEV